MIAFQLVGETALTAKYQVTLPASGIRELGWKEGDHLLVETVDNEIMILLRRPASWTEFFAGKLSHVFGTHQENLAWLADERKGWNADERPSLSVDLDIASR